MRRKEPAKESAILRSALEVFAEQGFRDAQVARIAERAGIGTGTLYIYFHNKREILIRIFADIWAGLHADLQTLVARDDMSPVEKLDAMIDVLFDSFAANPTLAMLVSTEHDPLVREQGEHLSPLYERSMDLAEKVFVDGIKAGHFTRHLDIKAFRQFLLGGLRQLLHQWGRDPQHYSLNGIRQQLKHVVKHGILSVKG